MIIKHALDSSIPLPGEDLKGRLEAFDAFVLILTRTSISFALDYVRGALMQMFLQRVPCKA